MRKNKFEIKINRQAFERVQKIKANLEVKALSSNAWVEIFSNIIAEVPDEKFQSLADLFHITDDMLLRAFLEKPTNRARIVKMIKSKERSLGRSQGEQRGQKYSQNSSQNG